MKSYNKGLQTENKCRQCSDYMDTFILFIYYLFMYLYGMKYIHKEKGSIQDYKIFLNSIIQQIMEQKYHKNGRQHKVCFKLHSDKHLLVIYVMKAWWYHFHSPEFLPSIPRFHINTKFSSSRHILEYESCSFDQQPPG